MKQKPMVAREQVWLNGGERARLQALEAVLQHGMRTFVEVGKALTEIRDRRLYRESHGTFEAYCREQWDLTRRRAYELIDAAGTSEAMSEIAHTPAPASESVAKELGPLRRHDPKAAHAAWQAVLAEHGDKPTAEQVRETVHRVAPGHARGERPSPTRKRTDTRFTKIESAVALLRALPDPEQLVWPEEAGDEQVVIESLAWLEEWLPKMTAERDKRLGQKRLRVAS